MNQKKCFLQILLFISLSFTSFAQINKDNDSLKDYTFGQLRDKFYYHLEQRRNDVAKIYLQTYFDRTKLNSDSARIARAYSLQAALYEYSDKRKIIALDSALLYIKEGKVKNYPEAIYTWKGIAYERNGDFKNALDNYLQGFEYSKKSNNIYYKYTLKHNIGLIKRKLGKYSEAKSLFIECLSYEERIKPKTKWDTLSYLSTLSELVSVYRLNHQLDSAQILNKKGLQMSHGGRLGFIFELNKGILLYKTEESSKARDIIENIIPEFFKPENKEYFERYNLVSAYLYLGKIYKDLKEQEKANAYFKKVDSISNFMSYIVPESRLAYLELVDYYKSMNDFPNQLLYINKLLRIDSVLTQHYKSVNDQLLKEFDTKELIEEKEILIKSINSDKRRFKRLNLFLLLLVIVTLAILSYQYRKRKTYTARFKALLEEKNTNKQKNENSTSKLSSSNKQDIIGVSEKIIKDLSHKLENFEKNLGFLRSDVTTINLAIKFNSNPKYVSKVVHFVKKKNFTSYINDLRIEYVMEKLKSDSKFRNYTIKAISEEIGFNNTQSFSSAFYRKTGIYPSFYIKKLD